MTKIIEDLEKSSIDIKKFPYVFKSSKKNPEWSVEKLVSLRSCHIHNNAEIDDVIQTLCKSASHAGSEVFISRIPKYLTVLGAPKSIDTGTGEIFYEDYQTDDFKASRNRKIKTIKKFTEYYEPLYQGRKVSLLFHTFTRLNYSKQDMRRMLDNVKYRYSSIKREIRGYLWALEVSEKNHIHYHLIVAIDRVSWRKIPEALKFEDLWGQRTGVEFIKKSVKSYLSKYLYKSEAKLLSKRSYAISRKLK